MVELENSPIPEFGSNSGWKEILIVECEEPLVEINSLAPDLIEVHPEYFEQGIKGASPIQYTRKGNAERLVRAAELLHQINPEYKLSVQDAWRPLEVQQSLFDDIVKDLTTQHPDWDYDKIITEAQTYVSIPSTDPTKPSPHNTGGAIDLIITKNGVAILTGAEGFDEWGEMSRTNFYERAATEQEIEWRNNRRLLNHVMSQAGFINYPEEWWHFDYGNQFWAKLAGQKAIYGAVKV